MDYVVLGNVATFCRAEFRNDYENGDAIVDFLQTAIFLRLPRGARKIIDRETC